jgi:hypothetical protein
LIPVGLQTTSGRGILSPQANGITPRELRDTGDEAGEHGDEPRQGRRCRLRAPDPAPGAAWLVFTSAIAASPSTGVGEGHGPCTNRTLQSSPGSVVTRGCTASVETTHWFYLLRLLAFLLIIIAIVDKNRRRPPA